MANARKFEFKTLEPTAPGFPDKINYKELLDVQLRHAGAKGLSVGEMADRLEILNQITEDATFVVVPARIHEALTKELEQEKFKVTSANIVQFVTDFKNAPEVQLKAVE